jgi:hypothetical protein
MPMRTKSVSNNFSKWNAKEIEETESNRSPRRVASEEDGSWCGSGEGARFAPVKKKGGEGLVAEELSDSRSGTRDTRARCR